MEALRKENEPDIYENKKSSHDTNVPSRNNIIYNSYVSNYGARISSCGKLTSNSNLESWLLSVFYTNDIDKEVINDTQQNAEKE